MFFPSLILASVFSIYIIFYYFFILFLSLFFLSFFFYLITFFLLPNFSLSISFSHSRFQQSLLLRLYYLPPHTHTHTISLQFQIPFSFLGLCFAYSLIFHILNFYSFPFSPLTLHYWLIIRDGEKKKKADPRRYLKSKTFPVQFKTILVNSLIGRPGYIRWVVTATWPVFNSCRWRKHERDGRKLFSDGGAK